MNGRRVAGHSSRPEDRSTGPSSDAGSPRRWWNSVTKSILALGAVASAIGAILSLRPSPDPEDSGSFKSIGVTRMSISEYQDRSTPLRPAAFGNTRQGDSQERRSTQLTVEIAGSSDSVRPTPTADAPDSGRSSPPPSGETVSPAEPSGPTETDDGGTTPEPSEREHSETVPPSDSSQPSTPVGKRLPLYVGEVTHEVQKLAPPWLCIGCIPGKPVKAAMRSLIAQDPVDPNGEVVEPGVAAERILTVLKQTRTIGGRPGGKAEPVGLRISVNLEVVGLRGEPLFLSWSVLQRSGNTALPKAWRSTNLGYRLQATSDKDSGNVDFWVPMPKARGQYFVSIDLSTKGSRLAAAESPDFG